MQIKRSSHKEFLCVSTCVSEDGEQLELVCMADGYVEWHCL